MKVIRAQESGKHHGRSSVTHRGRPCKPRHEPRGRAGRLWVQGQKTQSCSVRNRQTTAGSCPPESRVWPAVRELWEGGEPCFSGRRTTLLCGARETLPAAHGEQLTQGSTETRTTCDCHVHGVGSQEGALRFGPWSPIHAAPQGPLGSKPFYESLAQAAHRVPGDRHQRCSHRGMPGADEEAYDPPGSWPKVLRPRRLHSTDGPQLTRVRRQIF